jgi:ABC-type ATPase with predicted acetyltransferase domain
MATQNNNQVLLKVSGLKVAYGGIQAVKGVDFEVREGELVSLIGSNGAGKTTTMKAITGTLPLAGGSIEYLGKSIKGQGPWDLVKQGLAMVPEGPRRVHPHDHHREPADGRLHPPRQGRGASPRTSSGVLHLPAPARAQGCNWPAPCPAASSRCWPWAAR